jgi:LDH2 family malate/lactate/ureidoglycolate dehydrogenase
VAVVPLREFAQHALSSAGMPALDAATTAQAMVWADLRGLDGHGVGGKLVQCVRRIQAGGTRADPTIPTLRQETGTSLLDGENAWGQVAGVAGMRAAIARTKVAGIGVAAVRDISSAAALGYYPTLAVGERMIGFAITNGPSLIAPWGGTTKLLGNQAHAIGCPAGRHFPILFDSATTVMSTGEMDLRKERGEQLPDGVLFDSRGEVTRDPAEWVKGLLVPIGGHRGYGLSLMLEILTGVLAGGARLAPNVGHPVEYSAAQGVSAIMIAIDPEISMPFLDFVERVDRLIDRVHASRRAAGVDRIYVPGERGYLTAQDRDRDGIPISAERAAELRALAQELGVAAW